MDLSRRYLAYCATIPHNGNDPTAVTQLVDDMLAQDDVNEERIIGATRITVGSHPGSHFNELDIETADTK